MAFLDPDLYRNFYNLSKEQLGNKTLSKWEDYQLVIDKNILDKFNQYTPINNYSNNKNKRGFRTSKNGKDTGLFTKINNNNINEDNNNSNNINNSDNIGNNFNKNGLLQFPYNNPKIIENSSNNVIKIIPQKIELDEDEK